MVMHVNSKASNKHPVVLTAHLDPRLSRWQWSVKWFLAIPRYFLLAFPLAPDAARTRSAS